MSYPELFNYKSLPGLNPGEYIITIEALGGMVLSPEKTIPIDELALLWVSTMIHYSKIIPKRLGEDQVIKELLQQDLLQFRAIASQLEMLFCTRPAHPWAKYLWRQNFAFYLAQIIRRSQLFFQHLSAHYLENQLNERLEGGAKPNSF
jgi:hypothetical protein